MTENSGATSDLYPVVRREVITPALPVEQREVSWFAVLTRPRHEKKAAVGLQEKGIKVFLPLCSTIHQWSDRRRMIESPLFPSYLFVHACATQDARLVVLRTSGVLAFVGNRGMGAAIPDEQIAAVKTILERGVPLTPHPFLNTGERIRIRGGCLDGLEGILVGINGDQSLVVSVEMIQRSLAVRVSGYQIERIQ